MRTADQTLHSESSNAADGGTPSPAPAPGKHATAHDAGRLSRRAQHRRRLEIARAELDAIRIHLARLRAALAHHAHDDALAARHRIEHALHVAHHELARAHDPEADVLRTELAIARAEAEPVLARAPRPPHHVAPEPEPVLIAHADPAPVARRFGGGHAEVHVDPEPSIDDARATVQLRANRAASDEDIHAHAARGVAGSGSSLPYLDTIQRTFGPHDVTHVQAHVGGAAAEASRAIGADAYATGDHVAFAGAPDLFLVAHEAAHVVQQRGGVQLAGGVGAAGDRYEQHADAVAERVVRGESAAELLGRENSTDAHDHAIQLRRHKSPVTKKAANALDPASLAIEQCKGLLENTTKIIEALDKSYNSALVDSLSAHFDAVSRTIEKAHLLLDHESTLVATGEVVYTGDHPVAIDDLADAITAIETRERALRERARPYIERQDAERDASPRSNDAKRSGGHVEVTADGKSSTGVPILDQGYLCERDDRPEGIRCSFDKFKRRDYEAQLENGVYYTLLNELRAIQNVKDELRGTADNKPGASLLIEMLFGIVAGSVGGAIVDRAMHIALHAGDILGTDDEMKKLIEEAAERNEEAIKGFVEGTMEPLATRAKEKLLGGAGDAVSDEPSGIAAFLDDVGDAATDAASRITSTAASSLDDIDLAVLVVAFSDKNPSNKREHFERYVRDLVVRFKKNRIGELGRLRDAGYGGDVSNDVLMAVRLRCAEHARTALVRQPLSTNPDVTRDDQATLESSGAPIGSRAIDRVGLPIFQRFIDRDFARFARAQSDAMIKKSFKKFELTEVWAGDEYDVTSGIDGVIAPGDPSDDDYDRSSVYALPLWRERCLSGISDRDLSDPRDANDLEGSDDAIVARLGEKDDAGD